MADVTTIQPRELAASANMVTLACSMLLMSSRKFLPACKASIGGAAVVREYSSTASRNKAFLSPNAAYRLGALTPMALVKSAMVVPS